MLSLNMMMLWHTALTELVFLMGSFKSWTSHLHLLNSTLGFHYRFNACRRYPWVTSLCIPLISHLRIQLRFHLLLWPYCTYFRWWQDSMDQDSAQKSTFYVLFCEVRSVLGLQRWVADLHAFKHVVVCYLRLGLYRHQQNEQKFRIKIRCCF